MPPDRLAKAIRNALTVGDGYVWVDTEYPSWWLDGPDATFGDQVRSGDDHKWIDPVYWRAVESAMPTRMVESENE